MQLEEYQQLRAYTRYDGIYLAILWLASFACTVMSQVSMLVSAMGNLFVLATPFFVAFRLKKYREEALGGHIEFSRALIYCLRVFFDGALLFAIFQWLYMKFLDGGRLAAIYKTMISQPEIQPILKAYGISQQEMNDAVTQMFSPTILASYSLIMAMIAGIVLSLLIAAIMKR